VARGASIGQPQPERFFAAGAVVMNRTVVVGDLQAPVLDGALEELVQQPHRFALLRSNPRVPLVTAVLPIASLAAADPGQAGDYFDPGEELGVLVAELALDPQPQGSAVAHR